MNERIGQIEAKLAQLRLDWRVASPSMKKWIEQGAALLKAEKEKLVKKMTTSTSPSEKNALQRSWSEESTA